MRITLMVVSLNLTNCVLDP